MPALPRHRQVSVPVSTRDISAVGRGPGTVAPGTITDAVSPKITPSGVRTAPVQLYFGEPTAEAADLRAMEIQARYYGSIGVPDQPIGLRVRFQAFTDDDLTIPDATAQFHVSGPNWGLISGDNTNDLVGNLLFLSSAGGTTLELTSLTGGFVYIVATFPQHYMNRGYVIPAFYALALIYQP